MLLKRPLCIDSCFETKPLFVKKSRDKVPVHIGLEANFIFANNFSGNILMYIAFEISLYA